MELGGRRLRKQIYLVCLLLAVAIHDAAAANPFLPPAIYPLSDGASGVILDFNKDGRKDVVTFVPGGNCSSMQLSKPPGLLVSIQGGDGLLKPPNKYTLPTSCIVANVVSPALIAIDDIDGDGHLDVVGALQGYVYVWKGNSQGKFNAAVLSTALGSFYIDAIQILDYFEDGHKEIVAMGV